MPDVQAVRRQLEALQDTICAGLEEVDGSARFTRGELERPGGGRSRPRVLEDGPLIERAAVNFTHTTGTRMPPAATARRPDLAGGTYQAVSVSLIVHPRNPFVPTSHANFRFFTATPPSADRSPAAEAQAGETGARRAAGDRMPTWWFGGGFDLTPYYGFEEDAVHWHRVARDACAPFGDDLYPRFKKSCDDYFYLKHRGEPRGVGGLFYDDHAEGDFEHSFAFHRRVSEAYLEAYLPIVRRRREMPWGEREREFQLYRRGRYVEFNLIYDRGTLFGLQAGARTESVLASMPPLVRWRYDWHPDPGTPEARLYDDFLRPRDWLAEADAEAEAQGR